MRLAVICGGRPSFDILNNAKPLLYIENSILKVKETLEENSWVCKENCISKEIEIDSLDNFFRSLNSIVEEKEINEFLFYYTGHGMYGNSKSKVDFQLRLESEQVTIAQLVDTIHKVLENQKDPKIALVIDSCYSGEAITETTPYTDIEILTSTDEETKSFEKQGLDKKDPDFGISVFSHYFCEAFNTPQSKDELCLEFIGKHVQNSQDGQMPYYDRVQGRDKIVIGYNKEINEIKKLLQQNFTTDHEFKKKLLKYVGKDNLGFQQILGTENFNELLLLAFKYNKAYLSCIFKEFGIKHSYLGEFSELGCMELRNRAEGNLDVKKVIVRITSNNGKSNDCTLKGWLQNSIDTLDSLATQNIDFTSDYISVLAKYIKEPLANKNLAYNPLELDLILDDMLMEYDFYPLGCEVYRFKITIQLLNREKKVMTVWEKNSAFFETNKLEKIKDYLYPINEVYEKTDIENCFSDKKILIDSSHNLLTTRYIEMIKNLGLPFVLTPVSDIVTKVDFEWQNESLENLRSKGTASLIKHYNRVNYYEKDEELETLNEEKTIQFIYDNYHDSIKLKTLLKEINETIK